MLGQGRNSEGWKVVFNKLFLEPAIVQGDERNNCFTKIQLVGQKYRDKTTSASKRDSVTIVLVFKASAFCY